MLSPSQIAELQSSNSAESQFENRGVLTLDQVVEQCRRYIIENSNITASSGYNAQKIREDNHRKIDMFLNSSMPKVEGFENDLSGLKQMVKDIITDYDIITEQMNNNNVGEIQINGLDEIFYEENGEQVRHVKGFKDKATMEKVIAKLNADGIRLNESRPFISTRSIEGHRVTITHPMMSPYDDYSVVIRKLTEKKFSPTDVLKYESIPMDALEFIKYIPLLPASWFTIGPTFSGKTVLNGIILDEIPDDQRIIFIENPTELRPKRKGSDGRIKNNVLQFQSFSPAEKDLGNPYFPSPQNLLTLALRQSPVWIVPGEIRASQEFKVLANAALTGHHVVSTFHSGGIQEAMMRYLTAYLEESNEPPALVMKKLTTYFRFVIYQERLRDGSRKVMRIAEITGVKKDDPLEAEVTTLFEFVTTGKGKDGKILGYHTRVNPVSERTQNDMKKAGIPIDRVNYFSSVPVKDNVCIYTTSTSEEEWG